MCTCIVVLTNTRNKESGEIQPTCAQPLPPPHLQCWKHVPAFFFWLSTLYWEGEEETVTEFNNIAVLYEVLLKSSIITSFAGLSQGILSRIVVEVSNLAGRTVEYCPPITARVLTERLNNLLYLRAVKVNFSRKTRSWLVYLVIKEIAWYGSVVQNIKAISTD